MTARRILHADADAFFVAVARLVDPAGAGKSPLLIVGGRPGGRGVVCSASYETRAFGVRSAMPIDRALRLCPDAMCVPVPAECRQKSREIRDVLERWTPVVEGASVDEWYLDLTGTERLYAGDTLAQTAQRIRADVLARTALSISIGGGPSKLIAKLAAERAKPRADRPGATGVLVVAADAVDAFLRELPLSDIPGVGPKAQARLASLGMDTVADALRWERAALRAHFGLHGGDWLYDRARGLDSRSVRAREPRKRISRERTFAKDIADSGALRRRLDGVAHLAAADLRRDGLRARTVTVKLRDADFRTRTATRTLAAPVESDRAIVDVSRELLDRLRRARRAPARLVGVALGGFDAPELEPQLALFGGDPEGAVLESDKDRRLSRAVDVVHRRFGDASIHIGEAGP